MNRKADLSFGNESRAGGGTGREMWMSPQRDDTWPQTVVVMLNVTLSLLVIPGISCGRWWTVQRHRHDVHDHDAVPRDEHGHASRLERLALEVQCHRAAAVCQYVKTAGHNKKTTCNYLVRKVTKTTNLSTPLVETISPASSIMIDSGALCRV